MEYLPRPCDLRIVEESRQGMWTDSELLRSLDALTVGMRAQ